MIAEADIPDRMEAVLLTGAGGPEKMVHRLDVATPRPARGEALIRVGAAGMNRTDVNTRLGWYGESEDGKAWSGAPLPFPIIQGADVCGRIVAVADARNAGRLGERVLVQPCLVSLRRPGREVWLGSERNGGFAQYVTVPAADAHRIESGLSDVELASFPCSWGTAANLLSRARLKAGERVLVTGASGGLGSAAVGLVRAQGARPFAVVSAARRDEVERTLATETLDAAGDLLAQLGGEPADLAVDAVGGELFPRLLGALRRGGRYAASGAAAGAEVKLDLRRLYLNDLTLMGATAQTRSAFRALIGRIESGAVRPVPVRAFPLAEFHAAQEVFIARERLGAVVVTPGR